MDERWRQRIQIEPDPVAAQESADRARKMALERFGNVARSRSFFVWPALVFATVFTLAVWITTRPAPVQPLPGALPAKVQFILSDGTKVQWVFSDQFAL